MQSSLRLLGSSSTRIAARAFRAGPLCASQRWASSQEFIDMEDKYGAHNYHPLPVVLAKGEGVFVWDVEGKRYFDFLSAYSAVNQGHCHPKILDALFTQAKTLNLTSRAFYNDKLGEFERYITEYFGFDRFLPMNTGAEGFETAAKLARRWAYDVKGVPANQAKIIVAEDNFHGRTFGAISASSDPDSFGGFGPLLPGFVRVPFNDIEALKKELDDPNVAGFMVEPIQGEAGVVVPDEGYLKAALDACHANNALFIADEVQTGCARTGKLLASDYDGIKPDAVILGKALSGGVLPISGVLASDEVMLTIKPGQHGSTFGGSPMAAAVGTTALSVIQEEGLVDNSYNMGMLLRDRLEKMNHSVVTTVRGRGLLNAIVVTPQDGKTAWDVCIAMRDNGLLAKPTHQDIIRFAPPLCITEEQVNECADIIDQSIGQVFA
eukprot:m.38907 g.38907  ORF g.38907 m.38907 type:complete len:436 (+) comp10263_c0_seq1:375-1682(+)